MMLSTTCEVAKMIIPLSKSKHFLNSCQDKNTAFNTGLHTRVGKQVLYYCIVIIVYLYAGE